MLLENKDLTRFEGYVMVRSRWTLKWREEPIALSRKSFDLLLFLIDHRDQVLNKDELLQALWPGQFVEESNLTQQIFLLRKALSRHESGAKIIETIPGRGYRFSAQVEEEPLAQSQLLINARESTTRITIDEEEIEAGSDNASHAQMTPARAGRRRLFVLAGLLIAALLMAAGWFGWQRWLDRTGGPPVDVVLTPIEGSTGDLILDRALVDALRMDLAQSPFVSVVSPARLRQTLTEMKHNPDEPMTAATAREVCERTNSQAVLRGSVARVGQHYLITGEATSCVNGTVLAEAKHEAAAAQDLPNTIDRLAETLRRKLGESRRSIERFDAPLFPGNTVSLEALKYYSQAEVQSGQGKYVDGIELMKKAVAADPSFAEAYYDLASYFRSTLDPAGEREAILKAYSLRDSASEPVRLAIVALYHSAVTQDMYEAERNYRNWTELYPRSAQAWNGLSIAERELGHHGDALIAAERALELRPSVMGVYVNLSYEQRQTGNYKGSLATCERAIAKGLDGDYVRDHLLQTVYALHDAALVQQQRDWAAAHPDAVFFRIEEAEIAITEGRFQDAHRLIPQIVALMRHHGLAGVADDLIRAEAVNLVEAGDVTEGGRLFRSVPVDPKNDISVLGLARVGDFASAESSLHAMQAEFPQGTIWNDYRGPEVQAIIALAMHKPKDALVALERVRPLDGRNPVIPMLRADAYLAGGDPGLAEKSYRRVIEGPFQNPDAEELPLSWLGLGRALAAQGNRPAAIDAYQHFLARWADADPDAKFLQQAKQEFATLQEIAPAK
jgi:DNA-binding winged helix-turn-helix (wHTH) protein/tetratricopeptide (TPR) repeat protein